MTQNTTDESVSSDHPIDRGTRVVYDRPEEPGRGEAVVRDTGVDDWERWYRAEDTDTGEKLMLGESSIITTRGADSDE